MDMNRIMEVIEAHTKSTRELQKLNNKINLLKREIDITENFVEHMQKKANFNHTGWRKAIETKQQLSELRRK